ncbi:MAG TPA: transglutaminase-like domain-containing protein [Ignavibacteriales bacterium]|nr:transglutaminase-like domain-containing protein [Ignavibacteriales bacterium]
MKTILSIILICTGFLFASGGKFPALEKEISRGNFTKASKMIDSLIASNSLSLQEVNDLRFEKDKMERIRLDFRKSVSDILPYIKKYYPQADEKMLEKWEHDNSLEMMVIDGQKKYFNRAASNLFLINKKAKLQKEKIDGSKDALKDFLKVHVPKIEKDSKAENSRLVDPVKMHITYTLTVKPNVVPDGETIRCWLPYPREGHQRQSDIKLLSVNDRNYILADNDNMQRTLYMEKEAVKDEPTVFKMELSYTCSSEWFNIDPLKVKPYDKSSELYKTNTSERAPHIVFSDNIKNLSKKIVGKETNPYLKARLIFKWINDNIPWAGAREYSTIDNIPEYALKNRHGDCGIKTLLFMTLARYNGIPTKWQSGWMMHPVEVNLHDWCEAYFEGYGWVPVDQSFGIQDYSKDDRVKYFYTNGLDSYRFTVNDDFSKPLSPRKEFPRSETVDFQRGEVEWKGGNLYFDKWNYDMDIKYDEDTAQK